MRPSLRTLRHFLWGVAVVCLGLWGWARLDAARFQAEAAEALDGARAAAPELTADAVEAEAEALERAVERELERFAGGEAASATSSLPAGARRDGGDDPGEDSSAATTADTRPTPHRPAAEPATVRLGGTELLGRLRIPRLGLSVVVAEGTDRRTLRRAAGRIPGTAPLGAGGNTGVAGHRDGVFRDLERAAAGDLVLVETPSGTERYRVEAVSIVPPGATGVLADDGRATLTLVTCYPFDTLGPAPERWVVRAVRI